MEIWRDREIDRQIEGETGVLDRGRDRWRERYIRQKEEGEIDKTEGRGG